MLLSTNITFQMCPLGEFGGPEKRMRGWLGAAAWVKAAYNNQALHRSFVLSEYFRHDGNTVAMDVTQV